MEAKAILLRLREQDTANGVTKKTLKLLAATLGVSETDAIHKVLADAARAQLPQYAPDGGPLSETQHAAIKRTVRKAHGTARVVESLFEEISAKGKARERKAVRATPRAR